MVHPDNRTLFSAKKEINYQVMITYKVNFNVYNYVKEDNLKGYLLCHSTYMNDILKKAKLWRQKRLVVAKVK